MLADHPQHAAHPVDGLMLATIDKLRQHQAVDRVSGVLRVIGEHEDGGP